MKIIKLPDCDKAENQQKTYLVEYSQHKEISWVQSVWYPQNWLNSALCTKIDTRY